MLRFSDSNSNAARLITPLIPPDEAERLAELFRYGVLDTGAEAAFDRITRIASTVFRTPIALVTLLDQKRQWFKSEIGLGITETARAISFCGHAITEAAPMVVDDAREDVRFSDNPLVTGEPRIRFYAGAPLTTPSGFKLGTLCVIDREPRAFSTEQRGLLVDLAELVVNELELRSARRLAEQRATSFEQLVTVFNQLPEGVALLDARLRCVYANEAMGEIFDRPARELLGWTPEDVNDRAAALSDQPRAVLSEKDHQRHLASEVFSLARPRRRVLRRTLHQLADPERPWLAMWTDVTQEDDQLRRSAVEAATDLLTGLPNRRAAEAHLLSELRDQPQVSVAMFDVDHFKLVNDTWGHAIGDEVLKQVATTLTSSARGGDFVARWGGEEFLAIVRTGVDGARRLAERVRAAVEQLTSPAGKLTISAGVAQVQRADEVARADERLYEAKRMGRNCVVS